MDEYSLHQVLVDELCAKMLEQMNHQVVCKSFVGVSLESGSSNRNVGDDSKGNPKAFKKKPK